jgi:hypothetical protein
METKKTKNVFKRETKPSKRNRIKKTCVNCFLSPSFVSIRFFFLLRFPCRRGERDPDGTWMFFLFFPSCFCVKQEEKERMDF